MERATLDVCIQVEVWNGGARQDQEETTGMGKPPGPQAWWPHNQETRGTVIGSQGCCCFW